MREKYNSFSPFYYPPVIKHGNGKSPMNGGLIGTFPLPCLITGGYLCFFCKFVGGGWDDRNPDQLNQELEEEEEEAPQNEDGRCLVRL